ncbi:DNA annealing helicase and endonuclease ZRANB3-like [Anneissia japonica]|uniref:DNA annealing helicase and endonuclease ZRANB3-like n=1 Tax=Anneissia japonica TaxID=1529436 RepID=UPI001425B8AD|nr:DNA annealing helicase and endonuclease ZRANB3-like [Anneissia japonica]
MAAASTLPKQLPLQLYDKLFDFQKEGVLFALKNDGRCLIGDEMGLGKTLQALSVAYCYKEEWPLLIIVPSSLRYPWIEELEKWFPELEPGHIHLVNSGTDVGAISMCKVCLVGYGLMRNDSKTLLEALHQRHFQVIVVDESHYLKNLKAARTQVLLPLLKKAKRLLLLTGTPALARPAELFPQLDCLRPGLFGTWSNFTKRFCDAGWRYFGRTKTWDTSGASNLEELHSKLKSSVLIRREKKDVLHQLPPKQRQKVPFDLADSTQKQDLDKHWKDLHTLIKGDVGDDKTLSNTTFEIKKLISQLYTQTGRTKIGAVCDYISMLLDNPGLKFLVFAHHRDVLTAVCQTITKYNREKKCDIKYIRIDGDVPSFERMHLVNTFQKDERTRVAVLSIQAAGVGLTFTAATDVVFAELHWTPGVLEQCEDRAHRIGQVNSIHIHYLIAKGSIDEWMWTALSRKVNVVSSALNGKLQHLQASVCDKEEIEFLNFATVWVPSNDADEEDDDDCYFSKEESKVHQDIRSFFTPKGKSPKNTRRLEKDLNKSDHELKENERNAPDVNAPPFCHHQIDPEHLPAGDTSLKCHSVHNDSLIFNDASLKAINAFDSITSSRKRRSSFRGCEISGFEENLVAGSLESPCPIKNASSKRRCITNVSVGRISGDLSQVEMHKYEDSILTSKYSDKLETSGVTPDGLSWSCSMCTYRNHKILPYCEMCNTAKPILKTVPKKKAQKSRSQKQRSSVSSTKRFSLSKIDFVDEDLVDFDISQSSKTLFPTPKRSPQIKNFKNIGSKKTRTRNVVDDFVSVPHQSDFATVEDSDTKTSSEKQNEKVCVDCYSTCTSCEGISLQQKKSVENESDLNESEQDTSILEDIAAAESWISSQSAPESSQEFWTCSECGFVSQAEECDSCWNPKPEKSQIITGETLKNYKDDFHISKSKKHETQPSEGGVAFGINSPHNIQKVKEVDASPSSTSTQPHQETSCETTSDELLEVKDELDDTNIVHHGFKYRPSLHTSRIYLYDEDGDFLGASFFPVDVHLKNLGSLPKLLQHPFSFKLVQQFVRRWNRLRLPQQKQLCKSGELFVNPQQIIDDMKWRKKQNPSTKRFISRDDLANSAVCKASQIGGSLRIITKPPNLRRTTFSLSSTKSLSSQVTELKQLQKCDKHEAQGNITEESSTCSSSKLTSNISSDTSRDSIKSPPSDWKSPARGSKVPVTSVRSPGKGAYLQAVDAEGCPLCIFCNKPCHSTYPDSRDQSADWDCRYCSENCKDDHKMQWKSSHYIRQQLFQLEHGICQLCGLDAQQLFVQTRNLPKNQRKEFLQASKYASLSVSELNKIIKAPAEGQFWHADHIVAVADGGGLCSLENFRTLCVMCHMTVTANQIRERSKARKTTGMKDIKGFFKPLY